MTTTSSLNSSISFGLAHTILNPIETSLSPFRKTITSPLMARPLKRGSSDGLVPNTKQRVQKRLKALDDLEIPDDVKKSIDKIQSTLFSRSISTASSTRFPDLALGHEIKNHKRCYTFLSMEILEKSSLKVLVSKDFKDELVFISSSKKQPCKRVINIDSEAFAIKSPSKSVTPIHDFHSERACLAWLDEHFARRIKLITELEKIELNDSHLINISLFTKLSSCTKCASVFGSDHSPHRAADFLQSKLQREFDIPSEFLPAISIVHQGLQHYHRSTRSSTAIPSPEFYHSSNLIS